MTTAEATAEGAFVYDDFATVDRNWLRDAAVRLRLRLRRTVREMLDAGDILVKARNRIGRAHWRGWLASEAQIAQRSACRLIAVASVFEKVEPEVLERFTPTALYDLAEPGVPQSLREYAVEQAQDKQFVTAGAVREWMTIYRDNPKASVKLASKDPPPGEVNPDEVHAAENWMLLDNILKKDVMIHLSASIDTESNERLVSGQMIPAEGKRKYSTGASLERVVLDLAGEERNKMCPKCALNKPLDEFSVRKDRKDGRNRYCLKCEAKRVAVYARNKAASATGTT